MALVSHSLGAYVAAGGTVCRNSFEEFERGTFALCFDGCARSSSRRVHSKRVQRDMSFSSCVSSDLFMEPFFHQVRASVFPRNCTSRVSTGIVASLDDSAKQQEKQQQQTMEDLLPDFDELSRDELKTYLSLELQSDLDVDTYKHYEIMFIIHEKNADEVQAVIDIVTGFVLENKGFIYRINDWGLRRLAYKIKKAEKGNYVLMNIEIGSGAINDLNSMFEKDERVIRHMVMSRKEAVSDDMEPPEEWRPSAFAEGAEVEEEEEEEEYEEYEEEEDNEEEEQQEEGQRNGELILERQQ